MASSFLKSLELGIRRGFNRRTGRGVDPAVVDAPRDVVQAGATTKILLLRQDRIGDVLVSVPVVRAIRQRYPQATIDMVLSTNNIAVRDAVEPFVSSILIYRKGLPGLLRLRRELRARRYDVVIDLMDNASSTSALLVESTAAPVSLGIDKENRRVYTHVVPLADRSRVHIVDRISRLLWPFGIDPATVDRRLAFPLTEEDRVGGRHRVRPDDQRRMVFAVNISGSDATRMYPEDKMVAVARYARSRFSSIETVILAAPSHRNEQLRIAEASGCRAIEPTPSFRAWAAVIDACDALLTPDTSTVHLAAAFGKPSVVLYVHDRPDLLPWYPYATPSWPVETTTNAIANIPIDDVQRAVDGCLETL